MEVVDRILAQKDDLYHVLNISASTTSDADIKRAFRRLALTVHPDKHVDKTKEEQERVREAFQAVKFAEDVLLDSRKLYAYKRGGVAAVNKLGDYTQDLSLFRLFELISLTVAKYAINGAVFINKSREEVEYWKAKRMFEEEENTKGHTTCTDEYMRSYFSQPPPASPPISSNREAMKDSRTRTPNIPHDVFWRKNRNIISLVFVWIILLSLVGLMLVRFNKNSSGSEAENATSLDYYLNISVPLYSEAQYPHIGYYRNMTNTHIVHTTTIHTPPHPTGCERLWRRRRSHENTLRNRNKQLPQSLLRSKRDKKRKKSLIERNTTVCCC
eukprot:Tbor_TRINITY_DN2028_c0_g1::TRINITY_DN2028_c0_g1_i1::g.12072::m.12072